MSSLGVHFSLSADEVQALREIEDEAERVDYLHAEIEETYFEVHRNRMAETDKAWDAIHRALTDGFLAYDSEEYPLSHVILGGEHLYSGDDFLMVLKTPEQVRDVEAALAKFDAAEFRRRYFAIDEEDYSTSVDDEDFKYTWENFQDLRKFWKLAAAEGRFVLFTVDQ